MKTEKLPRHILRKHRDEPDVVPILRMLAEERKKQFTKLRKMELFEENMKLICNGEKDKLFRERKTAKRRKMCDMCQGFYSAKTIWRHKKQCCNSTGLKNPPERSTVDVESLTSPTAFISQSVDHSVFNEKVLKRSRLYDDIYHVYRADELIMNTGMNIWKKKGQRDHQMALSSLRTMAINESPITIESSPRETC